MPDVSLHDPDIDDIEPIPFINPGLTGVLRIKNKADAARRKFLDESDLDNSEYFADVEYNNTLKYWSVVFCLSVDDEPAYKLNGQDQVESYVENYLGSKFYGAYESLALDIIDSLGLELKDLDQDIEVDTDAELDLVG
jgi:hypothetical protein